MLAFKLVIHNSLLKGDTACHRVANDNEKKNSCQQLILSLTCLLSLIKIFKKKYLYNFDMSCMSLKEKKVLFVAVPKLGQ